MLKKLSKIYHHKKAFIELKGKMPIEKKANGMSIDWFRFLCFNDISTFVGYLAPKLLLLEEQ